MEQTQPNTALPLVLRVPPWQPAFLFLVTAVCAAVNIYASPSAPVRGLTVCFGLAAFVSAVVAMRMYLAVDEDGIGVRRAMGATWVPWPDVSDVSVVRESRNRVTLHVVRSDSTYVSVPPSLVLPSRPMSTPRLLARLGDLARQIMTSGEPFRGRTL